MAAVLVDTGAASFLHPRKRNAPERRAYAPHLAGHTLALSFQSVAELLLWAEQNQWGPQARAGLDQFIARFVIIPYEQELARGWARVMTHARSIGRRLESADGWIAATAVRHGLPLVTHDADFVALNLPGIRVVHEPLARPE